MNVLIRTSLTLGLIAGLSACSMIPEYQQPDSGVEMADSVETNDTTAAELGWRQFFQDPALQQLIDLALENNRELRVASLSVQQLEAQYRIQRAARLPAVDGEAAASRSRTPESLSFTGDSGINEQYSVGLGITSWEIDFFGRIDSLSQSALQQYFSSQAARNNVQLSLVAQVADAWYSWQAARAQYQLAVDTREVREESYRLIEKRFDNGLASELDLRQSETAVHEARVLEAQYQQQANQFFTTLQLLTGDTLKKQAWQADWQDIGQIRDIPAQLSSEVLLQRPDVLQAEHQIKSANADIGAARAAFYPKINLGANLLAAFNPAATTLALTSSLYAPIFQGGRLEGGLNRAQARQAELAENYQQTVLVSFREVEDALATVKTTKKREEALRRSAAKARDAYNIAQKQYDLSVLDFQQSLDTQRLMLRADDAYVRARFETIAARIDVFKAMGGGWNEDNLGE